MSFHRLQVPREQDTPGGAWLRSHRGRGRRLLEATFQHEAQLAAHSLARTQPRFTAFPPFLPPGRPEPARPLRAGGQPTQHCSRQGSRRRQARVPQPPPQPECLSGSLSSSAEPHRPSLPPAGFQGPERRLAPGMETRGSVQSVRAQGGGGRGGQDACNQKGYLMLVSF